MNNAIQVVGAYAGLVALIATVILSLLLFSLARDVRRLREWAGGAPERDAEVRELSELVAEERSEELKVIAEREQRRAVREGYGEGSFWQRLGRPGRIMAVVAVILVLGAAGAWAGKSYLTGKDEGSNVAAKGKQGKQGKKSSSSGALKPGQIKVSVLNGTGGTESGLAAEYAASLENKGYRVGAVTNAPETVSASVVMYLKGSEAAAKKVGAAVGIDETELMSSEIAAVSPGSTVAAVIGADHTALPTGG